MSALPETINLDRLFERFALDHAFWLEALCSVADLNTDTEVRYKRNGAQKRFDTEIRYPGHQFVVVAKSRKWGFSTHILGCGLHDAAYRKNRIFRIVAHKEATNKDTLRPLVWKLYSSAIQALHAEYGLHPYDFMPRVTNGNGYGTETVIEFGEIGSAIVFSTAAGAGVGQGERSDELYLTEYADWEHASKRFSKLAGSQPKSNDATRLTIDFNADGVTNDAYDKYTRAKLPHDDPQWNGFTPFFAGINDVPEYYPPAVMEAEKRRLGERRFFEIYPSNDVEMWVQSQTAVFDSDDIDDTFGRSGGEYCQERCSFHSTGVDPASGIVGLDFQAAVTLGLTRDGILHEMRAPVHGHWPEDVFADHVHNVSEECPGLVVVERNVGSATIIRLRDLDTQELYRHRHRDKTGKQYLQLGFPMTASTKRAAITALQQMLRNGELALVTPGLKKQLKEYRWTVRESPRGGGPEHVLTEIAGAPDIEGAHDDLVVALMLAVQGMLRYMGDIGLLAEEG